MRATTIDFLVTIVQPGVEVITARIKWSGEYLTFVNAPGTRLDDVESEGRDPNKQHAAMIALVKKKLAEEAAQAERQELIARMREWPRQRGTWNGRRRFRC